MEKGRRGRGGGGGGMRNQQEEVEEEDGMQRVRHRQDLV